MNKACVTSSVFSSFGKADSASVFEAGIVEDLLCRALYTLHSELAAKLRVLSFCCHCASPKWSMWWCFLTVRTLDVCMFDSVFNES